MDNRYSTWPYASQAGRPNVAQHAPWGYPTLSQSNAYMVYGHPPMPKIVNHVLHMILAVITVGFWIPVWIIVMIVVHNRNTQAEASYWFKIRRYYEWEQAQRALNQGG